MSDTLEESRMSDKRRCPLSGWGYRSVRLGVLGWRAVGHLAQLSGDCGAAGTEDWQRDAGGWAALSPCPGEARLWLGPKGECPVRSEPKDKEGHWVHWTLGLRQRKRKGRTCLGVPGDKLLAGP